MTHVLLAALRLAQEGGEARTAGRASASSSSWEGIAKGNLLKLTKPGSKDAGGKAHLETWPEQKLRVSTTSPELPSISADFPRPPRPARPPRPSSHPRPRPPRSPAISPGRSTASS